MTANELANEVMEHYRAELPRGFNVNWMQEVATMLRQQQAEIVKLGSELNRIVELYTDKAIENEALKRHRNRLETLAEQMLQGDGNE